MPKVFVKWWPQSKLEKDKKDRHKVWVVREILPNNRMIISPLGNNFGLIIANFQVIMQVQGIKHVN